MNGSPIGIDDLAESMAVQSRPSQTMFGVDKDVGVSFKYDIYLDGDRKESVGESDRVLGGFPMIKI